MSPSRPEGWDDATLAAALVAADPAGLGAEPEGLAARLAAWQVLHAAGDPRAETVLTPAADEVQRRLAAVDDPALRGRMQRTVPTIRRVLDACRQVNVTIR